MNTYEDDLAAGRDAAARGVKSTQCPFRFEAVNVSQAVFEDDFHPRLNAWMRGWVEETEADKAVSDSSPVAAERKAP